MSTTLPRKIVILVSGKTNSRCFYCNRPAEVIDHFISLAKHDEWSLLERLDPNHPENLVPACRDCNARKSDKCPEDFMGNSFLAWSRSMRANARIGYGGGKSELEVSWGIR
jgi:hypothetical protein